ncbi:MAG: hypothetical protein ACR2OH_03405 [Microthrixaceae bacterium]
MCIDGDAALRLEIKAIGSSPHALAALYEELTDRVGAERASELWWAAFAATDASET